MRPDSPLVIDAEAEVLRVSSSIRQWIFGTLKRRGAVVGMSGGVDSSVAAALCTRALGPGRVLGVLMPERESDPASLDLARDLAASLGIETVVENVTAILEATGCYLKRDRAVRALVPTFTPAHRFKIVATTAADARAYRLFHLVVESADGRQERARITADAYLEIVAATNYKQRVRKMIEYHHADRRQFAVVGTANRVELDQGFFVKNGDGAADLKPLAHLYKGQVYQLAEFLGIPEAITGRCPTSDTFSLEQTQQEFYFGFDYQTLDICLYGVNNGLPPEEVAALAGLPARQVLDAYREIESKRRAAVYLDAAPLVLDPEHVTRF